MGLFAECDEKEIMVVSCCWGVFDQVIPYVLGFIWEWVIPLLFVIKWAFEQEDVFVVQIVQLFIELDLCLIRNWHLIFDIEYVVEFVGIP